MTIIRYATEEEKEQDPHTKMRTYSTDEEHPYKELVIYKKPTTVTMCHELSHLKLGHLDTDDTNDSSYLTITDEIEAWVETYRKLKRPKHLYKRFAGLLYTVVQRFNEDEDRALEMMKLALNRKGVPDTWKKDLERVKNELNEGTS